MTITDRLDRVLASLEDEVLAADDKEILADVDPGDLRVVRDLVVSGRGVLPRQAGDLVTPRRRFIDHLRDMVFREPELRVAFGAEDGDEENDRVAKSLRRPRRDEESS